MDLFVCQTAYQLLNAVTIVKMNNIEADVLFYDRRLSNVCDVEALRSAGFFHEIYMYYDFLDEITDANADTLFKKIGNTLNKIKKYPSSLEYMKKTPNADVEYERVFISYLDIPTEAVFFHHKKYHNSRLAIYDDGTYTCDCLSEKQNFLKRRLARKAFGEQVLDCCECLWVRQPNIIDKGSYQDMPLNKIDYNFTKNEQSAILSIFKTTMKDIEPLLRKIIIFDQPFKNKDTKKKQINLAIAISDHYGRENVVVKLHPSYKETEYGDKVNTYGAKVPFEVIINLFDIEKTILASVFSTACFTPKTISGKEPMVVFTYKAISVKRDGRDFNEKMAIKYINNLKKNYSNQDLVTIPNSVNDMFGIIDKKIAEIA